MESKRIVIRESVLDDCHWFARFESDPEITVNFSMDDGWCYEDIVEQFKSREQDVTNNNLQYTILSKSTGEPIGRLFTPVNRKLKRIHIDWFYIGGPENRNKGYGSEVLDLFLDYCFNTLDVERVGIDHFLCNDRVESLYLKKGFIKEGVLRAYTRKNGISKDLVYMSLLKNEYLEIISGERDKIYD